MGRSSLPSPLSSPSFPTGVTDADALFPAKPRSRRQGSFSYFLEYLGNWSFGSQSSRTSRRPSQRASLERPKISSPVRQLSLAVCSAAVSPLLGSGSPKSPTSPTTPPLSRSESLQPRINMNRSSMLHPEVAQAALGRVKQIKEASDMTKIVNERAKKLGIPTPPYEFLELIGKGAFGRVFKGCRQNDSSVVAVKIIDIDSSDYKMKNDLKDQAIKDFVTEISILQTLKDAKAKNVNVIHEAFNFHSQLWIISDYCPGGSVHTLMRACEKPGLEENFIIIISRELAIALKYVHEAGIIHRDVKSANTLITQEGQLQLCDFGVSGVLESNVAKRSTIIGTPYWMAPELHETPMEGPEVAYGTEVDCWAFGCTVYEMATGQPPNAKIMPKHLHRFLQKAPRLEDGEYSEGLKEFVSFCLVERPDERPSAEGILNHRYVANTSKKYPTATLRQLIERYAAWEKSGGQRASLWYNIGAAAPTQLNPFGDEEPREWNFSTTADFSDDVLSHFAPQSQPDAQRDFVNSNSLSAFEQAQIDARAQRGEAKMARLFDENADPYVYSEDASPEESDLPFRRSTFLNNRETMIDLDDARASQDLTDLDLDDAVDNSTIRAKPNKFAYFFDDPDEDLTEDMPDGTTAEGMQTKRATREWKFPSAAPPAESQNTMPSRIEKPRPSPFEWSMQSAIEEARNLGQLKAAEPPSTEAILPPRPQLKHTMTEPIGNAADFIHLNTMDMYSLPTLSAEPPDRDSLIDLDASYPSLSLTSSFVADSSEPLTASTEFTDVDPFSLDPNEYNDRTVRAQPKQKDRTSLHAYSLSEPAASDRSSGSFSSHARGGSIISNPEPDRESRYEQDLQFHARNMSVQASIESLRRASVADDEDETDELPSEQALNIEPIDSDDSLLTVDSDQTSQDRWKHYDKWKPSRSGSIDDFHSSIISDMDDYQYQSSDFNAYSHGRNIPSISTASFSHSPTPPRPTANGRQSRRRYESDADSDINYNAHQNMDSYSSSRSRPRSYHARRHYRILPFPEARPPNPEALDDGADPSIVAGELERLLDGYMQGLEAASLLLEETHGKKTPAPHGGVYRMNTSEGIDNHVSASSRSSSVSKRSGHWYSSNVDLPTIASEPTNGYGRGHMRGMVSTESGGSGNSSRDLGLMMAQR